MTNYGSIPTVEDAEADIVSWNDHRRLVDDEMARSPESMFTSLLQKIQTMETPDLLTPLKTMKDNVTTWMSPEKSNSIPSQENLPERSFVGTVGFDDPDEGQEQKRKRYSTPMLLLMLLLLALSGGFLLTNTKGSGGITTDGGTETYAIAVPVVDTVIPTSSPSMAAVVEEEVPEAVPVATTTYSEKVSKAPPAAKVTTTVTQTSAPTTMPTAAADNTEEETAQVVVKEEVSTTTESSATTDLESNNSEDEEEKEDENEQQEQQTDTNVVTSTEEEEEDVTATNEEETTDAIIVASSQSDEDEEKTSAGEEKEDEDESTHHYYFTYKIEEEKKEEEAVEASVTTEEEEKQPSPIVSTATASSVTVPAVVTIEKSEPATSVTASTTTTTATAPAVASVTSTTTGDEMKASNPILPSTSSTSSTPSYRLSDPPSLFEQGFTHPLTIDLISLSATNEYGPWKAASDYPWMSEVPGTVLVEPYKHTQLALSGPVVAGDEAYTYVWEITGEKGRVTGAGYVPDTYEGDLLSRGTQQDVFLKQVGIYTLNVYLLEGVSAGSDVASKPAVAIFSTRIVCKYVKRELRQLTHEDKEQVLDAMAELWRNRQEEGQAKYGKSFTSIDVLVAVHSLASNDVMCDGFHEGTGFISHHLALTNTFEQSMRAVNPAVTLPYWDFTIEGETIKKAGKKPSYMLEITPVFQDDWFGDTDPVTNRMITSRWAGAKMPKQKDLSLGVQNSYGFIRSYWNNNPDDEISRKLFNACGTEAVHKMIPNCQNHYDVLACNTLGCFQSLSPADGHGPMHVQIGGMWGGCEDGYHAFTEKWAHILKKNMTNDEIAAVGYKKWKWGNTEVANFMLDTAIMGEYFHIYRSFWRSHMCAVDGKPKFLTCPESCDAETTPFEECICQVDDMLTGATDWKNLWPCVLNSVDNQNFFKAVMPDEMMEDMTLWLSTSSVQEGEMIESASTADPLFWLTHPVIERLLSAKRLPKVNTMGEAKFDKWSTGYDGNKETWLEFSYYTFEKGQNKGFPDMAYRCVGHADYDPVLPADLTYTAAVKRYIDENRDGLISNWEFYLALDPNYMEGNDYVWDHFEWPHCTSESIKTTPPPLP